MKALSYVKSALAVSAIIVASSLLVTSVQANNDFYQVTNVEMDDSLNIRAAAGTGSPIIGTIPANGRTILTTGNSTRVGSSEWVEVVWLGQIGWVNSHYLSTGSQPAAPQPVSYKTPVNVNYQPDVNEHNHPSNRCTRSITHSHANGQGAHRHNYSCDPNQQQTMNISRKRPANVVANYDTSGHTHPRNECTNSITHSHPNGENTHNHRYSCKSNTQVMSAPKYHAQTQPKYHQPDPTYIQYNN